MRASDPLTDPVPTEVPLKDAPLVRVIAQVRFPPIASIERADAMGPFQEAIRQTYPILREEKTSGITFGPAGVLPVEGRLRWRFLGASESELEWNVSLTREFVALETQKYTSRNDFLSRLEQVLTALATVFQPARVDRIGVRYIDRIEGKDVAEIKKLVHPDVLGIQGLPLGAHASHAITDAQFNLDQTTLHARWGLLPKQATVDPSAIEPVEEVSWILDLDMYTVQKSDFDTKSVIAKARSFAERNYAFFRWSVTNDFLRRFGGDL